MRGVRHALSRPGAAAHLRNQSIVDVDRRARPLRAVNRGFVLFVAVRTVGTLLDSAVLAALAPSPSVAHGGAR